MLNPGGGVGFGSLAYRRVGTVILDPLRQPGPGPQHNLVGERDIAVVNGEKPCCNERFQHFGGVLGVGEPRQEFVFVG
jgi:hypothetical protein